MVNFKVKKGKKFFWGPRWNFFGIKKKEFNTKVFFHHNCSYRLHENNDQINKLCGQSFRIIPWYDKIEGKLKPGHHKESVRFGWRCVDEDVIEILAYVYVNGVRHFKSLITIEVSSWVHLNFKDLGDSYKLTAITDDGQVGMTIFKKQDSKKGFLGLFIYRLYPYFGGKIPAPHRMDIELEYVKKLM
jgi:hypothetical protein